MFIVKDFRGFSTYEKVFFGLFILAQIAVLIYFYDPAQGVDWINVIASVSGILCVIMSAKGRLSTFIYGLIQVATYGWISYQANLMGEVYLQVVFGIFQFIGLYTWIRNMHTINTKSIEVQEVDTKGLTLLQWVITLVAGAAFYLAFAKYLEHIKSGQPFLDAFNVSLNLTGQVLMSLRFKEQWFFWIVVNIVSITLWVRKMLLAGKADDTGVTMVLMWVGFLINSIYGYYYWKKLQVATKTS
ncbi:nicotinamide riboside transporter PnuC [Macrococcoides caseolyticum]|uniref:nicotinamide riboside transporter PnuC n=1 Tax=Macrococcoides caseolyticum TaxID=69966 RepID=UPI001F2F538B|nr:nicotinamide riboside transporter PnuC [Macrococcus caseolyticus]MCE4956402.1 nicotinamide riboside transporter PnuC [Macrococcus caseolyticus]